MDDYFIGELVKALKPLVASGTEYLKSLKKESQIQIRMMERELDAQQAQIECLRTDKEPKGLMKAPFGYCPECGEVGVRRRINNISDSGYATQCAQGHVHDSKEFTVLQEPEHKKDQESGHG